MKKPLLFRHNWLFNQRLYFLLFCFLFFPLYSSLIKNPALPNLLYEGIWISDTSPVHLRGSLDADFLIDKKLKSIDSTLQNSELKYQAFLASLALDIKERLDLIAGFGRADLKFKTFQDGNLFQTKANGALLWHLQAKLILLEIQDTTVGFDAKYVKAKGKAAPLASKTDLWLEYRQWQLSLGVSQNFRIFFPYLGGVFNDSRLKIKPFDTQNKRVIEKEKLGVFLGCSITNHSYVVFNFEVQVIAETSLNFSLDLRF